MRTLIFGTVYTHDQASRYVATLCGKLLRRLNPDADIMLVDSGSPEPIRWGDMDFNFGNSIGHLSKGGADGWGRAFCKGMDIAIDGGYDMVLGMDADILLARPAQPIMSKMRRAGVVCACPMDLIYHFIENGLFFADVRWLERDRLHERYGWHTPPPDVYPERRIELLCQDDLFTLPMRGWRNDHGLVTAANFRQRAPYGCDYMTHADPSVYRAFLAMNGLEE